MDWTWRRLPPKPPQRLHHRATAACANRQLRHRYPCAIAMMDHHDPWTVARSTPSGLGWVFFSAGGMTAEGWGRIVVPCWPALGGAWVVWWCLRGRGRGRMHQQQPTQHRTSISTPSCCCSSPTPQWCHSPRRRPPSAQPGQTPPGPDTTTTTATATRPCRTHGRAVMCGRGKDPHAAIFAAACDARWGREGGASTEVIALSYLGITQPRARLRAFRAFRTFRAWRACDPPAPPLT